MFMCFAGTEGWACSVTWIMMIIIFFVAAIIRRQASEWIETGFSLIGAVVLGELVYIISLYVFSSKVAFMLGFVGVLVGGFIGAMFLGDTE